MPQFENWGMEETDLRALDEHWKRLVMEYREARRQARVNGCTSAQLQAIDHKHTFLVDTAYARLKYAEAREAWRAASSS